jgi:tetratricopeptide (TPR) repeat protein
MFPLQTVSMQPLELEHPNAFHLRAAQGWLELGNATEAAAELEKIWPALREHPRVLEVRCQAALQAKRWSEALALAETLCQRDPDSPFGWIHRAFCLHELKRTEEAWNALLPVAERFPKEWLVCYNLACYACQLRRLDEGKTWFMRALELGDPLEINRLASADADLKPLFQ